MRQTGGRRSIRGLIGFELFIKTACLSFCFPVFRLMMNLCMKASGYSYITKKNLFSFVMSPLTLFCIITVIVVTAFFVLFEMSAVSVAVRKNYNKSDVTVTELFFGGLHRMRALFRRKMSGVLIAFLTLLFVVIANLPVVLFCIWGIRQTEGMARNAVQPMVLLVIVVLSVLIWWVTLLGCAIVLLVEIENGDIGRMFKTGIKGIRNCYGKIIVGLFQRSLLLMILEMTFYFVGLVLLVALFLAVAPSKLSGVFLLRVFERYHLILCILFASVNAVIYEYFCGTLFLKYRKKEEVISFVTANVSVERKSLKGDKINRKKILLFAGIAVFFIAASEIFFFFRSGTVLLAEALDELSITAHRGASDEAPENTLAAIVLAVEEGADYVEIDVRLTADGVPVLMHDEALFRTTRVYNNIGNVTYEEVAEYDAGSSYSAEFAGERVPSLEEVLEQFGGQVGFNIELKSLTDRELAEKVVELVEQYHLKDSCVITSASYEQLRWIKSINPELKTGQILSFVYGNFYENEAADFFSIRSDNVSESLVERVHSVGKEVHVWTVNRENELKRMKAVGVDNIITNKPAFAREVVFSSKLAETLEEWITLLVSKK